ncbi:MAG: hypothetical protein KOO63_15530 [Bacteroidales bacterium]|nr:hypothetical protein [Candidatus Latescibacterota bacterium]
MRTILTIAIAFLCFMSLDLQGGIMKKEKLSIEQHIDRSVVVVFGEILEATSYIDKDNTARVLITRVFKGSDQVKKEKEIIVGFPGLGISELEREIRSSHSYKIGDKGLLYVRKIKTDKYYWTERFVKDSADESCKLKISDEIGKIEKHLSKAAE